MYEITHAVVAFLNRILTRNVRGALYSAGAAAIPGLVASGDLPAWALPFAAPLLLALLKLSPEDVDEEPDYDDPELFDQDEPIVEDVDLGAAPYLEPMTPKDEVQ